MFIFYSLRTVKRNPMRVVVKAKSWNEYRRKTTENLKRIQLLTGNRVLQYLIDPAFGPTVFCLDLWILTEDTWVLLKKTWTIPTYERSDDNSPLYEVRWIIRGWAKVEVEEIKLTSPLRLIVQHELELMKNGLPLTVDKSIVLDGVIFSVELSYQTLQLAYQWKSPTEAVGRLNSLLETLEKAAGMD